MRYFSKDESYCNFNLHYDQNYSFEYFCQKQRELGVRNVELLAGSQNLFIDHLGIGDISSQKKALKDNRLTVRVISAQNCRYRYQFAVSEKELIEQTYEYFANAMRLAAELDCHIMQANTGWGYWNEDLETGRKRCAEMFSRLCELGDQLDVTMACESLRPQESLMGYRAQDIKHIFDMVDHPRFKVMIDLTAMGVAGETIRQWFDIFGAENIIHTHMIDGDPYFHFLWGEGKRNLGEDLKALYECGYKGMLSQELTYGPYYLDPFAADVKNLAVWSEYLRP